MKYAQLYEKMRKRFQWWTRNSRDLWLDLSADGMVMLQWMLNIVGGVGKLRVCVCVCVFVW